MLSPSLLERFLGSLKNRNWEPGFDDYKEHFRELNRICMAARAANKEAIEGHLFLAHPHDHAVLPEVPDPELLAKRRNYATYIITGTSLIEIGFNAGHSALLALTINPRLTYFGIDLGHHGYTAPCFAYLRSVFGARIDLMIGDSRELLPPLLHGPRRFDLFHIDGGHGFGVAHADLATMIALCQDGDVILFDDTNLDFLLLDELCDLYAIRGLVTRIATTKLWSGDKHVLLRVNKPQLRP